MDSNRIKGAAKELKGEIKQQVGHATGDDQTFEEGTADKVEGKVQNTVGKVKDKIKDALS
jgi:uncharacterized protein YjbJ (UPF0337 family)